MKLFLKILIFVLLFFIVYQTRWILSFKYEPEYFENFYYESQYSYPSSARGISDATLYKFVGYRLTQGENPFNVNWEIPPFGKALYGYSSKFFGNPYWFTLFCYIGSLIVFYIFLAKNFKKSVIPLIGILMLILIPHFSNQVSDTMLDLPLTFAYLANVFYFFAYIEKKKYKDLLLSGLFLGIAASIKPPIYIPFILLSELVVVYLNEKSFKKVISLPIFVVGGYVLGYFTYFIRHPNPFPWIRLHKKIYDFYLGSKLSILPFAATREIFNLGSWGIIYIAGLICFFVSWYRYFKNKKDLKILTLLLFSTTFLLISSFMPFFPRYLLPLSFVFVLLILYVFKNKLTILILICALSFPFLYRSFKSSKPDGDALAAARFIETRADRELYRSIKQSQLKEIPEGYFIDTLENFNNIIGTRKIQVTVGDRNKNENRYYYNFKITYLTRFGVVENVVPFEYESINNQWKLNWNWDYLYGGYQPGLNIEFKNLPINLKKEYEVYVIPRLMYDWNKNLNYLSYLTGISSLDINKILTTIVPNDFERFVGYLDENISLDERDKLIKEKGPIRIKEIYVNLNAENEPNFLKF